MPEIIYTDNQEYTLLIGNKNEIPDNDDPVIKCSKYIFGSLVGSFTVFLVLYSIYNNA